jgi:DNA-binding NtrC family response regulator
LIARAIHFNSRRAAKPFLAVNCGALPESFRKRTFRTHERRVYRRDRRQKRFVSLGEGGTLFLDEIGEMPLALCRLNCCARFRNTK